MTTTYTRGRVTSVNDELRLAIRALAEELEEARAPVDPAAIQARLYKLLADYPAFNPFPTAEEIRLSLGIPSGNAVVAAPRAAPLPGERPWQQAEGAEPTPPTPDFTPPEDP